MDPASALIPGWRKRNHSALAIWSWPSTLRVKDTIKCMGHVISSLASFFLLLLLFTSLIMILTYFAHVFQPFIFPSPDLLSLEPRTMASGFDWKRSLHPVSWALVLRILGITDWLNTELEQNRPQVQKASWQELWEKAWYRNTFQVWARSKENNTDNIDSHETWGFPAEFSFIHWTERRFA